MTEAARTIDKLAFIEATIERKDLTWAQKLGAIIAWEKRNEGLKGFRASVYPKEDGTESEPEEIAHDICLMELASARGQFKDITNEDL